MALSDIDHIVVLMLENRSFDSLLGTLYRPSGQFYGLAGNESNKDAAGADVKVWSSEGTDDASMSIPGPDPGELFVDMNTQLFGVPNPPVPTPEPTMSGFVLSYLAQATPGTAYSAKAPMHFYTPAQAPVISTLARSFAVCDRWHASAPCQTWPNRFFAHTGTAGGYENNDPPHFPYEMETIFNRLEDARLGWKIYFHDMPQSLTLARLWPHADNFRFYAEFQHDARMGTLPAYSFIEPRYFADLALPNDQHPPHNVTLGEQLIADVYTCLRNGPGWPQTLLIITYDEHGGSYDHLPPPKAVPPSGTATTPFNFDRFGVRVPAVIVSPYVPPGSIVRPPGDKPFDYSSTPFDHTSIIATLRKRFPELGAPLTARDAAAPDLAGALTLPGPTNNGPAGGVVALPYVPSPKDVAIAHASPLNDLQQGLVQLAAHLPATAALGGFQSFITSYLDHLRTGAVGTDGNAIQNVASAVGLIKSRLDNLFASLS